MNRRMDRSRLNVGTYILQPYARSERHIKELSECGIDFVVCMGNDRPALDLFEKYGVGAIVSGVVPGWWGGDGDNAGKMAATNPLEKYDAAAASFADHPAIWGIDAGDEPSALDFPHYGKVLNRMEKLFPNQFAYLNLYPNYASVAKNNDTETVNQLGTATYAEHIERYCQCVASDYICYDFYMYSASVAGHYENLAIVADACRNTGRGMWIVLQVNSLHPEKWITENQLRMQAYSSLAFGAENIIWACYTAGWWHNQVVDGEGRKTEQYEKLKTVNAELRALSEEYMKFRRVSTHFVGFGGREDFARTASFGYKAVESLDTGVFFDFKVGDGSPLIVGQMAPRGGSGEALFVCSAADPYDTSPGMHKVTFRAADGYSVKLTAGSDIPLLRSEDGAYSFEIPSCGGVLLTAK